MIVANDRGHEHGIRPLELRRGCGLLGSVHTTIVDSTLFLGGPPAVTEPIPQLPHPFIEILVAEGIATLAITRPQAGNALNWAVLEQLRGAISRATADPTVEAIVITGSGSRFVSGADLGFFVRCLQSADMGRIVECIRASQEVFDQIATCPKPVVAAVQGAAVGGGVELALACRHIVATPCASFSFPETSLGIVPFSGGTYRTPRRIGAELTRWLVYTGQVVPPPMALKLGLIDEVVMPDQLLAAAVAAARTLRATVTPMSLRIMRPDAKFAPLCEMFSRQTVESLRGPTAGRSSTVGGNQSHRDASATGVDLGRTTNRHGHGEFDFGCRQTGVGCRTGFVCRSRSACQNGKRRANPAAKSVSIALASPTTDRPATHGHRRRQTHASRRAPRD